MSRVRIRVVDRFAAIVLALIFCRQAGAEPSHQSIGWTASGGTNGQIFTQFVDINQDRIFDVIFSYNPTWATGRPWYVSTETVNPLNGASIAREGTVSPAYYDAAAVGPAQSVGPQLNWVSGEPSTAGIGDSAFENQDTSIGVRLMIAGEPHYAWVRLRHFPGDPLMQRWDALTVYDTAWETTANTPIRTPGVPEPAGLGSLAAGLLVLRRRQCIA
jgi:hypothetical protein